MFVSSAEVQPWQIGIIPHMAPIHEEDTSRQPSESSTKPTLINKSLARDGSLHFVQCVPYAAILQIFYCLAWFDAVEINHLPCPNNEIYDDAVFDDRFRYQITMVGFRVFMLQYRLLHADIAYEIDTDKIISALFQISYYLHDLIRLNSIVCYV